jgi:CRP/FNR family transcriptional regulator, cyclic AMP receptor protein
MAIGNAMAKRPKERTEAMVEDTSLSAADLFRLLPASSLQAFEKHSTVRDFTAGRVFFRPGESGEALFVLEKGCVQTFRTSGNNKLIIAELTPPAVFGEMGCIGQGMYHCRAQAIKPSRIRTVSRAHLEKLLQQCPELTRRFLDLISQRFLAVLQNLESTSFRNLIPRMAALLLAKAKEDTVQGLTHQELAQHLRVYRESATAALGELRTAGIISIGRKQIRIVDRARLERAARE